MSELSPIDQSLVDVMQAGREAVEIEEFNLIRTLVEARRAEDMTLTVGGLLVKECIQLRSFFVKRADYQLHPPFWKRSSNIMPDLIHADHISDSAKKGASRLILAHQIKIGGEFISPPLFPQEPEFTQSGRIIQGWRAIARPGSTVALVHRVENIDYRVRQDTVLKNIHTVQPAGSENVAETDQEAAQLYFPLGLVMEASRLVKASVPDRISRKW